MSVAIVSCFDSVSPSLVVLQPMQSQIKEPCGSKKKEDTTDTTDKRELSEDEIIEGLRRDVASVTQILQMREAPAHEWDETYAYLEAHVHEAERVQIVASEFLINEEMSQEERSQDIELAEEDVVSGTSGEDEERASKYLRYHFLT